MTRRHVKPVSKYPSPEIAHLWHHLERCSDWVVEPYWVHAHTAHTPIFLFTNRAHLLWVNVHLLFYAYWIKIRVHPDDHGFHFLNPLLVQYWLTLLVYTYLPFSQQIIFNSSFLLLQKNNLICSIIIIMVSRILWYVSAVTLPSSCNFLLFCWDVSWPRWFWRNVVYSWVFLAGCQILKTNKQSVSLPICSNPFKQQSTLMYASKSNTSSPSDSCNVPCQPLKKLCLCHLVLSR